MNQDFHDDAFDTLLRRSMQSRSELPHTSQLAQRAMARAGLNAQTTVTVTAARWKRLNQWLDLAAAITIAAVLLVGYWLLPTSSSNWPSDTATQSTTTDISTIQSQQTADIDWLIVGAGLFIAAVTIVRVERAVAGEDFSFTPGDALLAPG